MNIMVTGGEGFIGRVVCRKLSELGHNPLSFDIKNGHNIKVISNISNFVEEHNPKIVIHLACIPIAKYCNENRIDAMNTIIGGTQNILEVIKERSTTRRFVNISSSMVYGNFVRVPISEDDPKCPIDIYGACKLSAEIIVKVYARKFGIPYTIIRPSAVYGPGDVNMRVSQIFLESALNGKRIVMNDGENTRLDFTYVEDIADGIVGAALSDNAINETFNVTYGHGRSLLEYATILKGYFPDVEIVNEERDASIPSRGTLDISKANIFFGYKPKFDLEKGIEEYVKWKLNQVPR